MPEFWGIEWEEGESGDQIKYTGSIEWSKAHDLLPNKGFEYHKAKPRFEEYRHRYLEDVTARVYTNKTVIRLTKDEGRNYNVLRHSFL
ncbi:MAG: hypothetical protein ABEJ72_02120 [Candidatus Aenigmatarchaeota archaeon]